MKISPIFAWACVDPWGGIAPWSIAAYRKESMKTVAHDGFGKPWSFAYGRGWRCIRVSIQPATVPLLPAGDE